MKKLNKTKKQQGFTLIELMIVVAIIGALAAAAIPAYQNYLTRSETASGLATVKALITPAEMFYQENGIATAATLAQLGTASDANDLGTLGSTLSSTSEPVLTLTFGANSSIGGGILTFTRSSSTGWSCARSGTPTPPAVDGCQ
ncbi:pilin [Vibrio vulnificus]|uniref:pilin n=1 Tax=Vibrio vulnificus TaxID=672 RepID=UPI001F043D69|nr:pilin [Vibrio vulnificus]MCG9653538.1 pilin [Vibrio vulnificus]